MSNTPTKKQLEHVVVMGAILLAVAIGLAIGQSEYYRNQGLLYTIPQSQIIAEGVDTSIIAEGVDTNIVAEGVDTSIVAEGVDTSFRAQLPPQRIITDLIDTSIIQSLPDLGVRSQLSQYDVSLLSCLNQNAKNAARVANCLRDYRNATSDACEMVETMLLSMDY